MRRRLVNKDKIARKLLAKSEYRRLSFKYIVHSDLYSRQTRSLASRRLARLSKGKRKVTRVLNYCVISGRSRAVYRDFRLSRIKFRELALTGKLYGVSKSSW